jgi:hypothetical protein
MSRKLLVWALVFGALTLVAVAVALPAQAAPTTQTEPVPQSPSAPLSPSAPNAQPIFEAQLSGTNEVPPVTTDGSGRALLVLDDDLETLHYWVSVTGLTDITAAHIHIGKPGVNGPVVFPLFDGSGTFDTENPISGTLTLTPIQVTELIAGNYYVNVHTADNPDGEIRGQVGISTEPSRYAARLSGVEEVPPVYTEASGRAEFVLNASMDTISYTVSVANIGEITEASVYRGRPGEIGTPVIPLYEGVGPFDEDNPITDTVPLDARTLLDLVAGNLYVNVLTTDYPEGEIRGPIAFDAVFLPIIFNNYEAAIPTR